MDNIWRRGRFRFPLVGYACIGSQKADDIKHLPRIIAREQYLVVASSTPRSLEQPCQIPRRISGCARIVPTISAPRNVETPVFGRDFEGWSRSRRWRNYRRWVILTRSVLAILVVNSVVRRSPPSPPPTVKDEAERGGVDDKTRGQVE